MLKSQQLTIRSSELRQKLNDYAAVESPTDEQRAEADAWQVEYRNVESQLRAALTAEADEADEAERRFEADGAGAELARLEAAANVGAMVGAIVEGRSQEGAQLELAEHHNLAANQIPLTLLRPPADDAPVEARVDAVTPAPGTVGAMQHPIIPYVFPQSAAAWIGIAMPTVGVGEQLYPVLTTPATAGTPAKAAGQDAVEGAFGVKKLSPRRAQASFLYNREDAASFAQMPEALRMNLSDAIASKIDQHIIADGPEGLLGDTVIDVPDVPDAVAAYADYRAAITGRVDGRYASTPSEVRLLWGDETYRQADGLFRTATTDESAAEMVRRISGGGACQRSRPRSGERRAIGAGDQGRHDRRFGRRAVVAGRDSYRGRGHSRRRRPDQAHGRRAVRVRGRAGGPIHAAQFQDIDVGGRLEGGRRHARVPNRPARAAL